MIGETEWRKSGAERKGWRERKRRAGVRKEDRVGMTKRVIMPIINMAETSTQRQTSTKMTHHQMTSQMPPIIRIHVWSSCARGQFSQYL